MRLTKGTVVLALGLAFLLARAPQAQTFSESGSLNTARLAQTTTLLNNGEVLVAGGCDSSGQPTATAELYNPSTGTFTYTGSMGDARFGHQATLLQDGTVLVTGGFISAGSGSGGCDIVEGNSTATAELYNPANGTFTLVGNLNTKRGRHSATLLPSGEVLIAGGETGDTFDGVGALASAELYNPTAQTFAKTGSMPHVHVFHIAELLSNGSVLVAGGNNGNLGQPISTAELYNPSTGKFTSTGSMSVARDQAAGALLNSGLVLVAGGNNANGDCVSSAELYNPSSGTFALTTGSMSIAQCDASATVLSDNTVLIAGGQNTGTSAEIYSPSSETFAATGSLITGREDRYIAALLTNGKVLIAGGAGDNGPITDAELYNNPAVGYIDPKYLVVGVTYAPPGPSSNTFVNYTNSTTLGVTNSFSNTFTDSNMFSVSLSSGTNIPMVESSNITTTFAVGSSQSTKNSLSVTTSLQSSSGYKTFGTANYFGPVNNDYDTIWVWLNPVLIFSVDSNGSVTFNGYGFDGKDEGGLDIEPIALGYLNGDFGAIPPDIQMRINRSWASSQLPSGQNPALTSADLAQIATADPFSVSTYGPNEIGSSPPTPETADHRFTITTCNGGNSFPYQQADPSQTPEIFTCSVVYTTNSTQAQDITTSLSLSFAIDSSFSDTAFMTTFSSDVKSSNTLQFTTDEQSSISSSTSSTASLSVQGPPCGNTVQGQGPCVPVYDSGNNEPTQFFIYEDNMYGTFMFAPVGFF